MIDFKNSIQKSRISLDSQNGTSSPEDHLLGFDRGVASLDVPDRARRVIAAHPSVSVAAAFIIGGILGWLTSRR